MPVEVNERAEIYRLHAEFCKTLSDANRLLILAELSKSELPVNELTHRLGLQQSNVSKHLALMKEHGLVNARREGSAVYYSLSDPRIHEAIALLRAVQSDQLEKRRALAGINPELSIKNQ
jgi:DNA-binding transcriptional ArsR family regulator